MGWADGDSKWQLSIDSCTVSFHLGGSRGAELLNQARRKRCGMAAVAAPKICREREREKRKRREERNKRGERKERGEKGKKGRGEQERNEERKMY